MLMKLL